jgi:hypothetical protein
MKRNQLILLVVLVAAIGGAGLYLHNRENASWQGSDQRLGQKLIENFPLNDVAHIRIKDVTNEVNLIRKDDVWTVQERGGYPASFAEIGQMLRKFWEMTVAQPQNVSAAQLNRFELVAPGKGGASGTLVEFKGKDGKNLQTLLLGKKHMRAGQADAGMPGGGWPDGRYVMVGDSVSSVALVTDALTDVEPKAEHWLDKELFKVEKVKSVAVTSTNATNNWTLTRDSEQGDWKLAEAKPGEEVDKSKVSGVANVLSAPSFTDVVLPDKKPEELGLGGGSVATIETFDGFTYKVSIGDTNGEGNYYIRTDIAASLPKERTPVPDEKPEDKARLDKEFKDAQDKLAEKLKKEETTEKWSYVVSKWTIDPLLKERKDLIAEKKEETTSAPTITPGVTSPSVTRPGELPPSAIPPLLLDPEAKRPPLPPSTPPTPRSDPKKSDDKSADEKPPETKPAEVPNSKD